jgi:hypothetical protein
MILLSLAIFGGASLIVLLALTRGDAALRLGLAVAPCRTHATGVFDGFQLRLQPIDSRSGEYSMTIEGSFPPFVKLRATTAHFRSLGLRLRSGDPDFDAVVHVEHVDAALRTKEARLAQPAEIYALLDAHARRVLREAIDDGFALRDDRIFWHGVAKNECELERFFDLGLEIAHILFEKPGQTVSRLVRIFDHDPLPSVRRAALHALLASPYGAEVPQIARLVMHASDVELRVIGAAALGDEGLRVLAATVEDENVRGELRVLALDAIRRLSSAQPQEWFSLPRLAGFLKTEGALALWAVEALVELGDPSGEGMLVERLRSADRRLELAIVRALAGIGSIAAIGPLRARTAGFLADAEIKAAANGAILRIQGRSSGSPGALSLTGEQGGELSLLEEEGRLTIAGGDGRR